MKILIAAASLLTLSVGFAVAAESDAAKPSATHTDKMSPGTTGAMKEPASGVATNPNQVEKQGGMATAPKPSEGKGVAAGEHKPN